MTPSALALLYTITELLWNDLQPKEFGQQCDHSLCGATSCCI